MRLARLRGSVLCLKCCATHPVDRLCLLRDGTHAVDPHADCKRVWHQVAAISADWMPHIESSDPEIRLLLEVPSSSSSSVGGGNSEVCAYPNEHRGLLASTLRAHSQNTSHTHTHTRTHARTHTHSLTHTYTCGAAIASTTGHTATSGGCSAALGVGQRVRVRRA
jgi:hypothetical protein